MTLTEFLLARIAEDEADAWRWLEDFGTGDVYSMEKRCLAECKAKRRILEECDRLDAACIDGVETDEFREFLASVYADHSDYNQWRP